MRRAKNPNRNQVVKDLAWNKCRVYIRKQSKTFSVRNTVPCIGGSAGKALRILKITDRRRHQISITPPPLVPVQAHRYVMDINLRSSSRRNIPLMLPGYEQRPLSSKFLFSLRCMKSESEALDHYRCWH